MIQPLHFAFDGERPDRGRHRKGWWRVRVTARSFGAWALGAYLLAVCLVGGCAHRPAGPLHSRAVELQSAGASSLANGELDRAAGQFALALEYEPRMAEAENGLGLVALRYGDSDSAARHFHAALAIDEDLAEAHLNLGGILLAHGETEEALVRFRAALAIDPGSGPARLATAETLLRLGRLADARWELAKLCEAEPTNADAQAAHALVLARMGRIAAAETAAQRAFALAPELPAAHRARAEILRWGGDAEGAEGELRWLVQREGASPASVEDRLLLGTVLGQQGRWDEAAAVIAAASRIAPRHAAVQFALAYAELARAQPRAAVTAANRALELRPLYPEARLVLADALLRCGDTGAGRAQLQRFLDEAPADMSEEKRRASEVLAGGVSLAGPNR